MAKIIRTPVLATSAVKPFPDKKYNIIYVDPCWSYRDKASAGERGASFKYPVQSLAWIKALPVQNIAADDCVLFLWVTMPMLFEAQEVMKSWGFIYRTCAFVWLKKNKKADSFFMGMGNWSRSNVELCLLATRGKPKRIHAGVRSIIDTDNFFESSPAIVSPIGAHSEKPPEARERIVQLMGDLPRIELFATRRTPGWDSWGLGVD